jgi:hypothetical protein
MQKSDTKPCAPSSNQCMQSVCTASGVCIEEPKSGACTGTSQGGVFLLVFVVLFALSEHENGSQALATPQICVMMLVVAWISTFQVGWGKGEVFCFFKFCVCRLCNVWPRAHSW